MKKILVSALVCAMLVPLAALSGEPAGEATLKAGDVLTFGLYEQDNDPANGAEGIEWRVLTLDDGKALVISVRNLEYRRYNHYAVVTWKTSSLRKWLNDDFLNAAFSEEERDKILLTDLRNDNNPVYRTNGKDGRDTQDRIFLLSIGEASAYFADDGDRKAQNTAYVTALGAREKDGYGWWWLRSPGRSGIYKAVVLADGDIRMVGDDVWRKNPVRPAFWLDLGG